MVYADGVSIPAGDLDTSSGPCLGSVGDVLL